jgi:hypothetical protein
MINATLYEKLGFNFIRDIAAVAGITRVPLVMQVNLSFPAKTIPEFIAYAKANPGQINFGTGGIGTAAQLARRFWQAHRRRNREVGQGDPGGQHQTGVGLRPKLKDLTIQGRRAMKFPHRRHLSSKIGRVPAALSVPRRSCVRRPMAIRFSWPV